MGFWRVLYRCARTIGHLTVGEFTVTGVPLFLFAFLVSSWEMDGKAECRLLGTSPCENERTIALRKNALRAYEGKSSELIPPGPRSRVGTHPSSFITHRSSFTVDYFSYVLFCSSLTRHSILRLASFSHAPFVMSSFIFPRHRDCLLYTSPSPRD